MSSGRTADLATVKRGDVWRLLGETVAVYTRQNSERIPSTPGIYAWYLPLDVERDDVDLEPLLELSAAAQTFGKKGEASVALGSWARVSLNLSLELRERDRPPDGIRGTLSDLRADDVSWTRFRRYMLLASLMTPPLYVGETGDLARRYTEHVGRVPDSSGFHPRFTAFMTAATESGRISSDRTLAVGDLLFATIQLPQASVGAPAFHKALEWFLKRMSRPPFGLR